MMDAASPPRPPPPPVPLLPGDDWELVAANEVHAVYALKQQGNALFQKRQLLDAIQVYAHALSHLPPCLDSFTHADRDKLVALEVAVLLNRALAYIELQDEELLRYAEDDCSAALVKQPHCVKAFYRRALAREQLGNIKAALADAEKMYELEPANPAALQLLTRLHEAWSNQTTPKPEAVESPLATALQQQCRISKAGSQAAGTASTPVNAAVDAWQALQDEELRLRQAVKGSTATLKRVNVSTRTPLLQPSHQPTTAPSRSGEVCAKTESLWATLAREEASTVAAVYKKRKPLMATGKRTNPAATIQPWRLPSNQPS